MTPFTTQKRDHINPVEIIFRIWRHSLLHSQVNQGFEGVNSLKLPERSTQDRRRNDDKDQYAKKDGFSPASRISRRNGILVHFCDNGRILPKGRPSSWRCLPPLLIVLMGECPQGSFHIIAITPIGEDLRIGRHIFLPVYLPGIGSPTMGT